MDTTIGHGKTNLMPVFIALLILLALLLVFATVHPGPPLPGPDKPCFTTNKPYTAEQFTQQVANGTRLFRFANTEINVFIRYGKDLVYVAYGNSNGYTTFQMTKAIFDNYLNLLGGGEMVAKIGNMLVYATHWSFKTERQTLNQVLRLMNWNGSCP